ncbi:MAG: phosphoribosylformylglycinamidine cyclo-ligase [Ktedonobacteraceae bacterium]
MTPVIRALVLRAPGINCDRETAQACRLAGFATDLLHINQLLKTPSRLLDYTFLVIPGGFSYGDDLGAGTLLAKNLTIHLGPQLRQFVDEGRPVLGICNGFQVLVRAGLLPGHTPGSSNILNTTESTATSETPIASLTDNMSAQFECRWITLSIEPSNCIFTQGIEHPIELPVAHGEGQFVLTDAALLAQLQANGQVPTVYTAPSGQDVSYPHNPNGSIGNIAGVCNQRGNVFGLMPHPERYVSAMQHPQRHGDNDGTGDGLLIFKNAYAYATLWARQSYATSGVDIAAADTAKALMQDAVHATHGPTVLAGMGAFAGVLDISSVQQMQQPALVASTDGVGTKTLLAITCPPDRLQAALATIGHDLVNHSVNDLLMQGAKPLFFMDYLAMGKLDPVQAATIVRGVAEACQQVGCALLGGETAEMPDVYLPGAFDLAGTIVGIVERAALVNGAMISAGDVILGLPSSGLHTNGYSLVRRVFAPYALDTVFPELGEPLGDALLRPHRCYLSEVQALQTAHIPIKGMAHITGGGFEGNIVRILPIGTQAVIETKSWTVPPLFQLLAHLGQVSHAELYRTLNMGIGMVLVLTTAAGEQAQTLLPELIPVGYIMNGEGVILH